MRTSYSADQARTFCLAASLSGARVFAVGSGRHRNGGPGLVPSGPPRGSLGHSRNAVQNHAYRGRKSLAKGAV